MSEPNVHASADTPAAALRLAEVWADFTKTFGIYPDSNVRVIESLDALLDAVRAALVTPGGLPIDSVPVLFFQGGVVAGGHERQVSRGSNLSWLHDRVHEVALAGVAFTSGVTKASIFAFTRRLLENAKRQDPDLKFEDLWPETIDGLQLVDRRFAGQFGVEPEKDASYVESWGTGGTHGLDLRTEQSVVEVLLRDDRIASTLEELRGALQTLRVDDEETERVDLLGRLIRQMPPDAMEDYESLVETVVSVVATIQRRLRGESADGNVSPASDIEFTQLMFLASHTLMARRDHSIADVAEGLSVQQGQGPEEVAPTLRGHAGDEAVEDDLELLKGDLEGEPPPFEDTLTLGQTESRAEQAGVCLHFFVAPVGDGVPEAAGEMLAPLLSQGDEEVLAVLAQYLDPEREGLNGEDAEARRDRILAYLRAAGLAPVLRRQGLISAASVERSFPADFGVYLDSLDPADEEDREELIQFCKHLGYIRIVGAADRLIHEESLFEGARLSRLFQCESEAMLTFARVALERGGAPQREEAIAYLKRVRGSAPEGCLLYIIEDPARLPSNYLLGLTELDEEGRPGPALRRQVAAEICRYVRDAAEHPMGCERRIYAIKHLTGFLTEQARDLLVEIVRAKKFFVLPRESKPVREAAAGVLRQGF